MTVLVPDSVMNVFSCIVACFVAVVETVCLLLSAGIRFLPPPPCLILKYFLKIPSQ